MIAYGRKQTKTVPQVKVLPQDINYTISILIIMIIIIIGVAIAEEKQ